MVGTDRNNNCLLLLLLLPIVQIIRGRMSHFLGNLRYVSKREGRVMMVVAVAPMMVSFFAPLIVGCVSRTFAVSDVRTAAEKCSLEESWQLVVTTCSKSDPPLPVLSFPQTT